MSAGTLRVVLGDQCSRSIAALEGLDKARDVVLMMEVLEECTYVPHHGQKIVLVLSAMRHFAAELDAEGVRVRYVTLGEAANTGSFAGEVARAVAALRPERVIVTEPGEWRVMEGIGTWEAALGVPVEVREDGRFLCSRAAFGAWAAGRKSLRMEFFYRDMRKRSGVLMAGGEPVGGAWNFDAENRKPLPKGMAVPAPMRFAPDAVTQAVMAEVGERFGGHFGALEGFAWPVTAAEARAGLADFVATRLARFGDYEDAMARGEWALFHALVSTSLNIGLLLPAECVAAAVAAYDSGQAPLNAVEGFVRQVMGWREFIRGLYWLKMPGYAETNALDARRPLPGFWWGGETRMACVRAVVAGTRARAYAHHIQRLMVMGNFALLAGLDPVAVNEWFMVVYADAFDWVELPNTHGMALFADGGVVGSKPYAASGAYINRLSDYCRGCAYDVKRSEGEGACPFNFLYWDFMARHAERFAGNPRMAMPLMGLRKMAPGKLATLRAEAAAFLASEAMSPAY